MFWTSDRCDRLQALLDRCREQETYLLRERCDLSDPSARRALDGRLAVLRRGSMPSRPRPAASAGPPLPLPGERGPTMGKPTKKGFPGLRCPHCGEAEALAVMVEALDLTCTACDEPVTRADVAALLDQWGRLLRWIDAAAGPATEEPPCPL